MKLKWAVVGAGGLARRRTIPEVIQFAQNSEIVSLMDVDEKAVRETGELFGVRHVCTTLDEILTGDSVAVYIASPVHSHYEQGMAALQAGKHVLIEKPMALNYSEARQMAQLSEKNGLKLGVALMMRYSVYHRTIKTLIEKGDLGEMVAGRAQLTCWYPPAPGAWRQVRVQGGGGALNDMGCHCIDLLEWFLGPVSEVAAFTGTLTHRYEVEDTSTVILRFENGSQGIVDNYFNVPDQAARNVLELYGTKGAVSCRRTIGQDGGGEMEVFTQEGRAGYNADQVRFFDEYRPVRLTPTPLYAQEIEAMSRWIQEGEKPLISYEIGLRNIRVVEAVYRSAEEKRTIIVD
ncbi:MAG TPA: Gfo/Idh/MocA family oxidoreductase [Atribacteraceae bacterium]|nr:Gfo/Idh/MocA family oxidoreductase [Atribacteraceae bacterium]